MLTMLWKRAVTSQQLMGQPLTAWVQPAWLFLSCGVDYAGPIYFKQGSPRSTIQVKCYVTLYICLAIRAVHLELINIRCLYCCPLKVDYMKGEMFKYALWQWDNICWSSSWSLRSQETFCIRSTSGKTSGICKFRSIYTAFYSLTLPRCWWDFRRPAHTMWIT